MPRLADPTQAPCLERTAPRSGRIDEVGTGTKFPPAVARSRAYEWFGVNASGLEAASRQAETGRLGVELMPAWVAGHDDQDLFCDPVIVDLEAAIVIAHERGYPAALRSRPRHRLCELSSCRRPIGVAVEDRNLAKHRRASRRRHRRAAIAARLR